MGIRSVRARLTLWYTGLLAVSLLAVGALVYSILSGIMLSMMDDRLAAQAQDAIALIRAEGLPPVSRDIRHIWSNWTIYVSL